MVWPPLLIRLAMAASGVTRVLCICLLVLSIAPWASVYHVLYTMHHSNAEQLSFDKEEAEITSLITLIQSGNTTYEDLYMLFIQNKNEGLSFWATPNSSLHHWTVLLPWVISLVLGIVIPFVLSICTFLFGMRNDDYHFGMQRKEVRLARLVASCEDYKKVWMNCRCFSAVASFLSTYTSIFIHSVL